MKIDNLIEIIEKTQQSLRKSALTAVNVSLTVRNWLIGYYIVRYEQKGEDRAKYGDRLMQELTDRIKTKNMKGMSFTNLNLFRQFYLAYPEIRQSLTDESLKLISDPGSRIIQSLTEELRSISGNSKPDISRVKQLLTAFSYTHFVELLKADNPAKRAFYETEAIAGSWSVRQLKRQRGSLLYERTALSKRKSNVLKKSESVPDKFKIEDTIKDPYILEFAGLQERPEYSENDLERALITHIQEFLLELGSGFCFEGRQYRITTGGEHDRIDLVFYHRILRCHVLIDLKIREFSHADAGQMNFYLNYFRDNVMKKGDNPPVGLILCTYKDKAKVKYSTAGLDNKLFVSKYKVYLPSERELLQELEREKEDFLLKEEAAKYGYQKTPKKTAKAAKAAC
jgi:predicted nuclease of restriction endonuclease-like (RecB) superfamily